MQTATQILHHMTITACMLFSMNIKDTRDALQRIGLIPQLADWFNKQCIEQLLADMKENIYFMNTQTPSEHIFMMQNILHHYNTNCNNITEASIW